jgi:hypothetical protein
MNTIKMAGFDGQKANIVTALPVIIKSSQSGECPY